MGHSSFRKHPHAVVWGPPGTVGWISAPAQSSPWTAGHLLLRCGLLQGLQGSVCSGTCYILLLFQLSPQGCFSHIFPHSSLPGSILPFFKYIFLKAPSPWLQGSAMPCGGAIGAGWNGLCPAQSSPGHSSQRSLKLPLPASGHLHPVHIFDFFPGLWSYCIFNLRVIAQVAYNP